MEIIEFFASIDIKIYILVGFSIGILKNILNRKK